jgi:hypothetical protein
LPMPPKKLVHSLERFGVREELHITKLRKKPSLTSGNNKEGVRPPAQQLCFTGRYGKAPARGCSEIAVPETRTLRYFVPTLPIRATSRTVRAG